MFKPSPTVFAAATLVAAAGLIAGPLNPPAGPVTPTYKTLSEIEPRAAVQSLPGDAEALHVISQPGSYYLTGDIAGVPGRSGIKIVSHHVTLDLNGFTLTGSGAGNQQSGVLVPVISGQTTYWNSVSVRNGSLRGWTWAVNGYYATNARFDHLTTSGNALGVRAQGGALITDCASESDAVGIDISGGGNVSRCVIRSTGTGIVVNTGIGLITDCVISGAGNTGIVCGTGGIVRNCAVEGATFYGIHLTGSGGEVRDCTAVSNGYHGIVVSAGTYVAGNTCRLNGGSIADGAGILAQLADNRIEANNVLSNDRGISTLVGGNLVIRNSASGNAIAYSLAAGTVAGPTVTAVTIATSTNPHANYDF